MKTIIALLTLGIFTAAPAFALEPIPGSIIYGGSQYGQLARAPVGSTVLHRFSNGGYDYNEVYLVSPDKSLQLVTRTQANRH